MAHLVNHALVIRFAKNGAAGHKCVCARIGHRADIVGFDAAVDFQTDSGTYRRGVQTLCLIDPKPA